MKKEIKNIDINEICDLLGLNVKNCAILNTIQLESVHSSHIEYWGSDYLNDLEIILSKWKSKDELQEVCNRQWLAVGLYIGLKRGVELSLHDENLKI